MQASWSVKPAWNASTQAHSKYRPKHVMHMVYKNKPREHKTGKSNNQARIVKGVVIPLLNMNLVKKGK